VNSPKLISSPLVKEKKKTKRRSNAPSPLLNFDTEKVNASRPKKVNATAAVAARMDPTVPSSPKAPSISSLETSSVVSTASNGSGKKGGKKKKKNGKKKKRESTLANETLNTNSSSSIGMSPVLNYNGVSNPISPQMYYQQMYNAAAAQVAPVPPVTSVAPVTSMPSPYYAAYSQSPYYGSSAMNMKNLTSPYNTSPYLTNAKTPKTKGNKSKK